MQFLRPTQLFEFIILTNSKQEIEFLLAIQHFMVEYHVGHLNGSVDASQILVQVIDLATEGCQFLPFVNQSNDRFADVCSFLPYILSYLNKFFVLLLTEIAHHFLYIEPLFMLSI